METSSQLELFWQVLPKETRKALEFLSVESWLSDSGWYLGGGTALALQTGHRTSVDLDFFTTKKSFEALDVLRHFEGNKHWRTDVNRNSTIYGELFGAKVSFIAYSFFIPSREFVRHGSVRILSPHDIAVMKIVAISQRGRKRDFFDLYWLARNVEPLEKVLSHLPKQYPSVAHDMHHILKSLVYFEDAEGDPSLILHFSADWEEVKAFFHDEIKRLTFKYV